ncbi:MAG TPA: hypothetical protein VF756_19175 [Thermoanaerobaculia bacterium]
MASEGLDLNVLTEPLEKLHEAVEEARKLRESLLHGDEGSSRRKDSLKSWDTDSRRNRTRA